MGKKLFAAVLLAISACSSGNEVQLKPDGKMVFYNFGGCANCHRVNDKKLVGPGLAGTSKRHSDAWLKKWLASPEKVWEENDAETKEMRARLGEDKKKSPGMKLMRDFSDDEIDAVVQYLKTL